MLIPKSKQLGQHFLSDTHHRKQFLDRIAGASDSSNAQPKIWDMGAGSGLLSADLLQRDCRVCMFECDTRWCAYLQNHFAEHIRSQRCCIVAGDMMATWKQEPLPDCIVGNFPFDSGIPFVMQFTEQAEQLVPIHAILQKEVVDRVCAVPNTKNYSSVSVYLQIFYRVEKVSSIPAGAFSPPPRVACASVSLIPRENVQLFQRRCDVLKLVKAGFSKRRKILRNNFKDYPNIAHKLFSMDQLLEYKRAEELSVAAWEAVCAVAFGVHEE